MAQTERLFALEAIVNEHSQLLTDLRESSVRLEQRVNGIEQRLDRIDQRLDRMDQRFDRIDARFDRLEDRLARQFMWIVGMQVTTVLAFVGSVVTLIVMRV
jgi:hypothetical protein